MKPVSVTPSILWVGDNDRDTHLFEGLWPLPSGVCYNTYLIRDEKTALVDSIKSTRMSDYIAKIHEVLDGKPLDYLIVNHMEPDHSGSISVIKCIWPDVKIVGNKQTMGMLDAFYGIKDGTFEVKDGDTLNLGVHKLTFALVPMVHWPETMVTYDATEKVLFSCDAFGGFGAFESGIFDDQANLHAYKMESLRYYACIVGRYSSFAQKAVQKVKALPLSIICPSHGPVFRKDPGVIVDWYDKWSRQETDDSCVLVYGSMYGNTKTASDAIARAMGECGVQVTVHDSSVSDASYILRDIWRSRGLVLASCTYNTELFPAMAKLTRALKNRVMSGRVIGLCGSYTWSKGALNEMQCCFGDDKGWTVVGPSPEIKSAPNEQDFEDCALLGRNMAEAIKNRT